MNFRKSNILDLEGLVFVIEQAKKFLKENGVNQWQDGYPYEEDLKKDIDDGISYVLTTKENLVGTFSISFKGESTYNNIYEGKWLTDGNYAVIHRVAIHTDFKGKGKFSLLLKEVENLSIKNNVFSIKIDTHRDNIPMQKTLMKNGFKRCGIIYLENKDERIAFEKII